MFSVFKQKKIFHIDRSDHVIGRIFIDRKSCKLIFFKNINEFGVAAVDVCKNDVDPGNHNVFGSRISKIEHIVDHLFFFRLDYPVFVADIHNGAEFIFCHGVVLRFRIDTE